jgi:hypothetical protein
MCWAMYLFTENSIDEIKWNEKKSGMYIEKYTERYSPWIAKFNDQISDVKVFLKDDDPEIQELAKEEIYNLELRVKSMQDIDKGVLKWNENNKNIYYIGSSQGCGCGWMSPEYDFIDMNDEDERRELECRIKDRMDLYRLLESRNFNESYIIICWEGDQGKEINQTIKLNIEEIKNIDYKFEELSKYIIKRNLCSVRVNGT